MKNLLLFSVFLLFTTACDFPAEDRCSAPYEWAEPQGACTIPPDTALSEEVDTSPIQKGLGSPCRTDADCGVFAPSGPLWCLLNPRDAAAMGMCTFTDCDYATCGGYFECCDCEGTRTLAQLSNQSVTFCVDTEPVTILTSIGCICE